MKKPDHPSTVNVKNITQEQFQAWMLQTSFQIKHTIDLCVSNGENRYQLWINIKKILISYLF